MLPSPSRLFSPRRYAALLRRDVELLSLDVFGLALRRMVLEPSDVHLLVANLVADGDDELRRRYRELRAEAEARARADLGAGLGIADIADRLEELLEAADPGEGGERARLAIRHELDIERLICRPDPEGVELFDEAQQREVPVAFVADSYLPRDLVSKLLQAARYRSDDVLVSSNEGELKAGGLLERLSRRTGVPPDRILHVGPDEEHDGARATEAGMRAHTVPSGRAAVTHRVVLGLTERSGLDSIGLALAADRLAGRPDEVEAAELGYVAGGPLVCGFTAWVVRIILDDDPDHVVFHGPTAGFIHRVALTLRPELAGARLHRFDPDPADDAASMAEQVEALCRSIGMDDGDDVLVVDLGWNLADDRDLVAAWRQLGQRVRVQYAVVGMFADDLEAPARTWAFGPGEAEEVRELAGERLEILECLLGHHPSARPGLTAAMNGNGGGGDAPAPDDAGPVGLDPFTREELAAGVLRFAEDLQPWLRLGSYHTTAALAEPALRVVIDPDADEARILAGVAWRSDDPLGIAWSQGHQALADDDARTGSPRLARRLNRRA